jgi:hypothetical protein
MCERRSLETLVGISKHPDLGPYVETLQISVYHLLPLGELQEIEPPYNLLEELRRSPEGAEAASLDDGARFNRLRHLNIKAYRKCLQNQELMMQTEYDIKCLSQAMKHLTYCKRIAISDHDQPWGLKRLRRDIGILPQRSLTFKSQRSIELVRHIIHITLATAATSELHAEELEISVGSLMENANRISPKMLNGPSVGALAQTPLIHIRHLDLTLDPEDPDASGSAGTEYSIVQFIGLLPALSYLRLEFEFRDEHDRFSDLSESLHVPALETLTLSMLDCTRKDMALFLLRHHKTLKEISFEGVNLTDGAGAWPWLLGVIRDSLDITYLSMMGCMADDRDLVRSGSSRGDLVEAATVQDLTNIINLLL